MPARSFGMETEISHAYSQRRRSERRLCDLPVVVRTSGGEFLASLLDLSSGGAGLRIATLMPFRPGARFRLVDARIGDIRCVVRWAMHPRYGVEFAAGPQTLARIHAFYDTLPAPPGATP